MDDVLLRTSFLTMDIKQANGLEDLGPTHTYQNVASKKIRCRRPLVGGSGCDPLAAVRIGTALLYHYQSIVVVEVKKRPRSARGAACFALVSIVVEVGAHCPLTKRKIKSVVTIS